MLNPLRIKKDDSEKVYACIHWRTFPPVSSLYAEEAEDLRLSKTITETDYQRHLIWVRECGLPIMEEDTCLSCTHCRELILVPHRAPQLVTLDGSLSTPTIDISTFSTMGHNRIRTPSTNVASRQKKGK